MGVVPGRDFQAEWADLREAQAGDGCPECGEPLLIDQVIEVGNIFKLGTKYTKPLGATVLDEAGQERLVIMGSYGIGPARIAAAAVEQHADDRGIVWPKTIAPFDVHLVHVQPKDEVQTGIAEELYDGSEGCRAGTCSGTTARSGPGVKFADAELIGCTDPGDGGQEGRLRDRGGGAEGRGRPPGSGRGRLRGARSGSCGRRRC